MRRHKVGRTGLEVTEICFGTSALGHMPDTYGYGVDEARARDTLHAIFDSPVNCLDTSRNYGFGRSEERIGAAIRDRGGLPEGFVISTKLDRDMETGRFDGARARRSLEETLTALGQSRVQILHLHDPEHAADLNEITGPGGAFETLMRLKEEGLCDATGLAMGRVDMMLPLLRDWPVDCIINHNRFTLLNRNAEALIQGAADVGIAVMNAAPYASGVLAKGTDASRMIAYQEASEAELEPVRAIERLCALHRSPMGAAALQFSTGDPRVASTIVGVSRPESVARTLEWLAEPLPPSLLAGLGELPFTTSDPEAARDYRPG